MYSLHILHTYQINNMNEVMTYITYYFNFCFTEVLATRKAIKEVTTTIIPITSGNSPTSPLATVRPIISAQIMPITMKSLVTNRTVFIN